MIDWRQPTLLLFGPVQGCGCPMEEWLYRGINVTIHFEPTGEVDAYFDAGDWDQEVTFASRDAAFTWIDDLPSEEDLVA